MKLSDAFSAVPVLQAAVGVATLDAQQRRRRSNVITAEELTRGSGRDTYDVIRALRPSWFVGRGTNYVIAVYVDGVRVNSVDDVRSIAVEQIKEVRFLSANDATTRYGTGNAAGAIEITTKR